MKIIKKKSGTNVEKNGKKLSPVILDLGLGKCGAEKEGENIGSTRVKIKKWKRQSNIFL